MLARISARPSDLSLSLSPGFTRTTASMYQQRWRSKRFLRAYHGDWIPERRFKRWFLPEALPALQHRGTAIETGLGSSGAAGPAREASAAERMPVASLFMRDVERRADTVVFRACFARSAYEARGLVVQGHVKLNGVKVSRSVSGCMRRPPLTLESHR